MGAYWETPVDDCTVCSVCWIANLDSCWSKSKTEKAMVNFNADLDNGFESNRSVAAKTDADRCVIENMRSHASKSTPQYGFSRGMKEFGDGGWKATLSELKDNLLGMDAVHMVKSKEIDKALTIDSLAYLMFLKRKRTGKIKAWGCVNGRPQRKYIGKEESNSPTVSLYSLMLTACIDSIENRKVVTADIPGVFLQSDWPEDRPQYLKFQGDMVNIMLEIDPPLKGCIRTHKSGKKVMYGKLNKAVYGTLLAEILFYTKLSEFLKGEGFKMNPYDPCCFTKMINGSSCTLLFYVVDIYALHKDQGVLDNLLKVINNKFKTDTQDLSITRGTNHD